MNEIASAKTLELIEQLGHWQFDYRMQAIEELAKIDQPYILENLLKALNDRHSEVALIYSSPDIFPDSYIQIR